MGRQQLGFPLNPQLSGDSMKCLVSGDDIYVMLVWDVFCVDPAAMREQARLVLRRRTKVAAVAARVAMAG